MLEDGLVCDLWPHTGKWMGNEWLSAENVWAVTLSADCHNRCEVHADRVIKLFKSVPYTLLPR